MYLDIWYITIQQDNEMSFNVLYQAILGPVYSGKTISVKSTNVPKWTPTDDNHKSAAQWSPDQRGSETSLIAPASIWPHDTVHNTHVEAPPGYHRRNGLGMPSLAFPSSSPAATNIARCWLDRLTPWKYRNNYVYFLHRCIDDASRNNFDTLAPRFFPGSGRVMARFYAMTIIVGCERAEQVLVLDGWMWAMGGQGVTCACKSTVLLERSKLLVFPRSSRL